MSEPAAAMLQVSDRIVAFIRPCKRSGVMPWRTLSSATLPRVIAQLNTKAAAIRSGTANEATTTVMG